MPSQLRAPRLTDRLSRELSPRPRRMAQKVMADASDASDETSLDTAEKGGADRRATRGMRVNFKVITSSGYMA